MKDTTQELLQRQVPIIAAFLCWFLEEREIMATRRNGDASKERCWSPCMYRFHPRILCQLAIWGKESANHREMPLSARINFHFANFNVLNQGKSGSCWHIESYFCSLFLQLETLSRCICWYFTCTYLLIFKCNNVADANVDPSLQPVSIKG